MGCEAQLPAQLSISIF